MTAYSAYQKIIKEFRFSTSNHPIKYIYECNYIPILRRFFIYLLNFGYTLYNTNLMCARGKILSKFIIHSLHRYILFYIDGRLFCFFFVIF